MPEATVIEDRGSTSIPAKVVAKIAEQAASEVAHIGSASGGVLGIGARRDFSSRPSAECDLYGRSAVLRLDVGVDFPLPLAPTVRALRAHVGERIENLTGFQVGRLDVEVSWLNAVDQLRGELR